MTEAVLTAVVCDGDPAMRHAVAEILSGSGVALVIQTGALTELRRIAAASSPSIIVLELALAGMSGLDVVRELRAAAPACAIVVLSPFTKLRDDAMAAGARGLVDPNDLRDLTDLLGSLTGGRREIRVDPQTIRLDAPRSVDQPGT